MLMSSPQSRPRRLLCNGIIMSTSFAGLEGCIIVTINLSACIIPPDMAMVANSLLYLFFALTTFAAPMMLRHRPVSGTSD